MKTIYRTNSGEEFEDREKALAYEGLARVKVSIPVRTMEKP